ncbi:ATP-dependent helicase [Gephyromycinifex aptenodytis]|uniref:ATP-dependent helicase n=1 Tax=Gephyromycinifex aptenodytis TaxID=2716227 RepID=UPI001444DF37|nr:ATP-dependent DNA helicase [Gephyromycinifex aptenodytis]
MSTPPSAALPRYSAAEVATALELHIPTAEQQAVIQAPLESMLVVAGAGSGKTETMAARVVWLVANDLVSPDEILGLTFTRKAAGELAERIGGRLRRLRQAGLWTPPEDGADEFAEPTVSTYHAYAGRLVQEHGLRLGVEPDARLLTEAAAWQYAHEIVLRYDGPMAHVDKAESTVTAGVRDLAGQLAEHLRTVDELAAYLDEVESCINGLPAGPRPGKNLPSEVGKLLAQVRRQRQILPLVRAYDEAKRRSDALDFSDQMAVAARLALGEPQVARTERSRFAVVLLDEFQDTSEAQMRLLAALFTDPAAGAPVSVTAVGDPHQSIYGWRGASATTLAQFPTRFGGRGSAVAVLPLSCSWRNDIGVLALANATAAPLTQASPVPVRRLQPAPNAGPGRVRVERHETSRAEAQRVAQWIAGYWWANDPASDPSAPEGAPRRPRSAAVLCRRRAQFAMIVDELAAQGLPVEVVGLGGLLTTPEVNDLVSLLAVVHDPVRSEALMRLLTGSVLRLGAADIDAFGAWSRQLHRARSKQEECAETELDEPSLVEALDELPPPEWVGAEGQQLSPVARDRLVRLGRAVAALRSLLGVALPELVVAAERALGLDVEVAARPEALPETARMHLDAFADVAASFSASADRPSLGGFLDWLDAAREEERGLDTPAAHVAEGAVQVLTVHAAKGLEWDVVAVPGLVEGAFPSHTAQSKGGNLPVPKDRGWTGGLGSLPYELRGDVEGLPELQWRGASDLRDLDARIGTFLQDGGTHGLAEERRLAYVAFTRARHNLLLTASVWTDRKNPLIPSRFLTEVMDGGCVTLDRGPWAPDPSPEETNPQSAQGNSITWPTPFPDDERHARIERGAQRVRAALEQQPESALGSGLRGEVDREIEVLLAEWAARRQPDPAPAVRLPGHLSASALVSLHEDAAAFALRLRRPMPEPPADGARAGTAFHEFVEQHYRAATFVDPFDLPGSGDEDLGDLDLEHAKERFLRSEWAERVPIAVEVSLETVVAGVPVRGRLDAVFPRPDGGVTIVDWKTGRPPQGERARSRAVQLAVYRLAYCRLHELAPEQVDACFYYAATGATVAPPLLSEAELAALLTQRTEEETLSGSRRPSPGMAAAESADTA